MSETTQSDLRDAIEFMKADSGKGTKARKQERFRNVYQPEVTQIVSGERYDDSGVGPMTAQRAVESVYPDLQYDEYDTISEALASVDSDGTSSLSELVADLDSIARRSGKSQKEYVRHCLKKHQEPSLVTLALLDDENIGLGTSQMRDAFHDGTRDERKTAEAFTDSTTEFIRLAQDGELPTSPTVGEPFAPMLAVPESRGQPDNSVCQMKIDGYRILIHVTDGEATAFSRAENDVTESLPELSEMEWPDGDYILDAEIIAENGSYSETSERIGRKAANVSRDTEMNFEVFDCVVYQGDDVSESKFEDRFNMAMEFVGAVGDERLNILPVWYGVEKAKDAAIEQGKEGIIVKDDRSPYEFGKRSAYWQKQKYDASTVDVIITDFHEGDGESSGTLGAVSIESIDGVPLGRSGSGFSDGQRDQIWRNRDNYLNRVIEVEARGLSKKDKMLRMPIFKRHRPEGEADPMSRIEEVMKDV